MAAGGEALYERYKDALKRGHVASLRGRLDEALDAYAEAAAIAPERPTPHTSAGTALMRRRRPAEALRSYDGALRLAPRDETALLGRAQALAALDRPLDAADAFDALADHRAASGKLADAVDAARRGLELAEGRDRRRTLERLIARLRASEPGEPGRLALERALLVLDGPAMAPEAGAEPEAPDAGEPAASTPDVVDAGDAAIEEPQAAAGDGSSADGSAEAATEDDAAADDAGPNAADVQEPAAGPDPVAMAAVRAALDRDVPPDADLDALARRAEASLDAGDGPAALASFLDLAAANLAQGHAAAAMDACYAALPLDPDSVDLHLALVQLYDDSGWAALAGEKLDLLDRLVALGESPDDALRVAAARGRRA